MQLVSGFIKNKDQDETNVLTSKKYNCNESTKIKLDIDIVATNKLISSKRYTQTNLRA